jgi:hypothetical protein
VGPEGNTGPHAKDVASLILRALLDTAGNSPANVESLAVNADER